MSRANRLRQVHPAPLCEVDTHLVHQRTRPVLSRDSLLQTLGVPWGIIRELNQMGYHGPLCVEWEDSGMERMAGAAEAYEYVKRINFEPSDISFDSALKN